MCSTDNNKTVLEFFETLENIGMEFENQQKELILSSKNTLTLGRSGTGKTTMSTFKILSL